METSVKSDGKRSSPSISSAGASPASPSPSLDDDWGRPTTDGSGPNLPDAFARYDPVTSSWRMSQVSLFEGWETFSGTWPPAGTMRSGIVSPRPPLVPRTSVIGSSLWRTPQEHNGMQGPKSPENFWETMRTGKNQITLTDQVRMWPTPRAQDSYERSNWKTIKDANEGGKSQMTLTRLVKYQSRMWPTASARDWKNGQSSVQTRQKNSRPL